MNKCLLIIDIQNDFCPGGSLAVEEGDSIIPYVNNLINTSTYQLIVASKDYHPINHISFAINHNKNIGDTIYVDGITQVLWPVHCVQNSKGAEFHPRLDTSKIDKIIYKGTNSQIDSYSAFYDNNKITSTGLTKYLQLFNINTIDVVGLALDYCVKYSCLDAIEDGFNTNLHLKGTKAVNLNKNDAQKAIAELKEKKVNLIL